MADLILYNVPFEMNFNWEQWVTEFLITDSGKYISEHATVQPYFSEHYCSKSGMIRQQILATMTQNDATYYQLKYKR